MVKKISIGFLIGSTAVLVVLIAGVVAYQPLKKIALPIQSTLSMKESYTWFHSYKPEKEYWEQFVPGSVFPASSSVQAGVVPHHPDASFASAELFSSVSHQPVETVIVLGFDYFSRASQPIATANVAWKTPFGEVYPDKKIVKKLGIPIENEAFENEQSITTQVPWIAKYLTDAKIVPIIIQENISAKDIQTLKTRMNELVDEKTLVVLSMNLSSGLTPALAAFHDDYTISALQSFEKEFISTSESEAAVLAELFLSILEEKGIVESELVSRGEITNTDTNVATGYGVVRYQKGDTKEKPAVTIMAFGDMMLGRSVETDVTENDLSVLFENIKGKKDQLFRGQDFLIANLEGPIIQSRLPKFKTIQFGFDPVVAPQLADIGFDGFSLANNHALDQKIKGLEETKMHLEESGLFWFGDQTKENLEFVRYQETGDSTVAFVGFNVTDNPARTEAMADVVKQAKENADLVVVMMHWGAEYQHLSYSIRQQEYARELVDAGADAVIGGHPHVVQPMEVYKGVPIFYSLGNFIFDQWFSEETEEGFGVGLSFYTNKTIVSLFPYETELSVPRWLSHEEEQAWIESFMEASDSEESTLRVSIPKRLQE